MLGGPMAPASPWLCHLEVRKIGWLRERLLGRCMFAGVCTAPLINGAART